MLYSTYLGGSGYDVGFGIAVDSSDNAYVTGATESSDFPTINPIQATLGGSRNVFVAEVNAAGIALVDSSYVGGSGFDYGTGIAVDSSGNAYVTGLTSSTDFPTVNPFQATKGAADQTTFAMKISNFPVAKALSMGPQAMEGNLKLNPGTTLQAGYDFSMPGSHPAATVSFIGAKVTFAWTCVSGPGSGVLVVPLADQNYADKSAGGKQSMS